MTCVECDQTGYLLLCDGCDAATCLPCSGLIFEPVGSYMCKLCNGDQVVVDENSEKFTCAICMESKPLLACISVDGCAHFDMKACSWCMFKHVYQRNPQCPFCNLEATFLIQVHTGRRCLVDVSMVRNQYNEDEDDETNDDEATEERERDDPESFEEAVDMTQSNGGETDDLENSDETLDVAGSNGEYTENPNERVAFESQTAKTGCGCTLL